MSGVIYKTICDGCEGCVALPMTREEYRLHYATAKISIRKKEIQQSKALVDLDAFQVFCYQKQQKMLLYIK
jgi:arginyl-tRNA--protein-N-Asp/Glu arginylyltransferase